MIQKIKEFHRLEPFAAKACGGLIPSNKKPWLVGYCPKCQTDRQKQRKFWVDTDLQICNCFKCGNPSKPMDIINLYCWLHDVDTLLAITELTIKLNKREAL